MVEDKIVPLSTVRAGKTVQLVDVRAGRVLKHRLAVMGILPNTRIKILRNAGGGQVVVDVKSSRIVLGRGMSHKIMVK